MNRKALWEQIYAKPSDEESWYQPEPVNSLRLIEHAGMSPTTCIIDVGGGDSRLVDHLLARGAECVTVLDVSGSALARARARLASVPNAVEWIEADITGIWHTRPADIWHDRAVLHFLTEEADRVAYRDRLREVLRPGGTAIIATFAVDGPERCSGLPVMRYSSATLGAELGPDFALVETLPELHQTPTHAVQSFIYNRFRRVRVSSS